MAFPLSRASAVRVQGFSALPTLGQMAGSDTNRERAEAIRQNPGWHCPPSTYGAIDGMCKVPYGATLLMTGELHLWGKPVVAIPQERCSSPREKMIQDLFLRFVSSIHAKYDNQELNMHPDVDWAIRPFMNDLKVKLRECIAHPQDEGDLQRLQELLRYLNLDGERDCCSGTGKFPYFSDAQLQELLDRGIVCGLVPQGTSLQEVKQLGTSFPKEMRGMVRQEIDRAIESGILQPNFYDFYRRPC